MADIPTQFKFEDLLHHTFPGLFSAITLFMLIDIWSPFDLTSFVIKDVNSLVTFIGFVILVGTILGIMIDGIHHLTQRYIFNNFGKIKDIHRFFEFLYPKRERDIKVGITRHYFFKALDKDVAKTIDEYLIDSKQRYSEFYFNTFISLIPFSLVVSFYLFYVLQIPWSLSIITALLSLSLASVCLKSSYNAYKDYLESLYSAMRGYLSVKYDPPIVKDIAKQFRVFGVIINITFVLIIVIIYYIINSKTVELDFQAYLFLIIVGIVFVWFIYYILKIQDNLKQEYFSQRDDSNEPLISKLKISRNAFGLTLTFLFMLFTILFVQFFYAPALVIIEPKTFAENIAMGNQSTKAISIKNIGSDLNDLTFTITTINKSWISLSAETIPMVKSGVTEFIQANLTIPRNATEGEYRGAIMVNAISNGKEIIESIPVIIQVKP